MPPVDPKNQDTSVLIGAEDISKLDRYPESDPRILELNGALNCINPINFREALINMTEGFSRAAAS